MTLTDVVLAKKWELDALRDAIQPGALDSLERVQRIDVTFTSNAIEGNTLTAGETALILEKGVTVSGKPLKDHLEAVEHAKALEWTLEMARQRETPIREADLRRLHRLATEQSAPAAAGRYADRARFVNASSGVFNFPPPLEVSALMATFCSWLAAAPDDPATAFEAHLRLAGIHPFNGGNGRAARLLMNLILARGGYPPISVRPEDRQIYIHALETEQSGGGAEAFDGLLFRRLDQTLDIYLAAAREAQDASSGANQKRT